MTGAIKKVKKGAASKPKKTKPGAGKKGKKAPATSARKGKQTADCTQEPICTESFTISNNSQVCFTGIGPDGCTLSQISGDVYPFSPVTGTENGLDYTDLTSTDNVVTVTVPAVNQPYPYNVSCCDGGSIDTPGHSVTVTN